MTRHELEALFRANLRHYREELGLSQSELARRIDRTPAFVCDIERARRSPTLGTIAVLSEALGVSPARLVSTVRSGLDVEKTVAPTG